MDFNGLNIVELTLREIAQAYSQLKETERAVALLETALTSAEQIENSSDKARALIAIAEAQANLQQWGSALEVTRQCPSHDCRVDSLSRVLTAYAEWQHPELKEKEKEGEE
jgi:tetratricopeptide (TPR) repeat protein